MAVYQTGEIGKFYYLVYSTLNSLGILHSSWNPSLNVDIVLSILEYWYDAVFPWKLNDGSLPWMLIWCWKALSVVTIFPWKALFILERHYSSLKGSIHPWKVLFILERHYSSLKGSIHRWKVLSLVTIFSWKALFILERHYSSLKDSIYRYSPLKGSIHRWRRCL